MIDNYDRTIDINKYESKAIVNEYAKLYGKCIMNPIVNK